MEDLACQAAIQLQTESCLAELVPWKCPPCHGSQGAGGKDSQNLLLTRSTLVWVTPSQLRGGLCSSCWSLVCLSPPVQKWLSKAIIVTVHQVLTLTLFFFLASWRESIIFLAKDLKEWGQKTNLSAEELPFCQTYREFSLLFLPSIRRSTLLWPCACWAVLLQI